MDKIRLEKFPLTPEVMFDGLVKNLHDLNAKADAEDNRRVHGLSTTADTNVVDEVRTHHRYGPDKFGCDPDVFARAATCHKPHRWGDAVQKAGLVPGCLTSNA